MTSIKIKSHQLHTADSSGFNGRTSELIHSDLSAAHPPAYRLQIDQLVKQIDSVDLRRLVDAVFQDLLSLLDCVESVEEYLWQADIEEDTVTLFQLIHDETRKFVEALQNSASNHSLLTEELADTFDRIAFAITHDLQRVFDHGGAPFSDAPQRVVVGKLHRAHGLLTNCLQQSIVTLAMVFDPELVGAKLFNNADARYRQSLQLCSDLSQLIQLLVNAEQESDGPTLTSLEERIEEFRSQSMECLMYSDWPQFEGFCEKIDSSKGHSSELTSVIHQFRCYMETLLGQVKMRNVLADVFPLGIGEDVNHGVLTTLSETSAPSAGVFHPQNADDCNEFAFAV